MSMAIASNSATMQTSGSAGTNVTPALKEAWLGLAGALRNDDLEAAKKSYAAIVKNASDDATLTRGSPFVQMGKALVKGDMEAAKAEFANVVRNRVEGGGRPSPKPMEPTPPAPVVTSSTGGSAGSLLNVSA